jgi:predicted nucleotidyltransferase
MIADLYLTREELDIVRRILSEHLPDGFRTYVFGSRATGRRLKPWSDLDLAVDGPSALSLAAAGDLAQAFDESLLAWKVDVIDLNAVSPEFRRIVDAHKVPLP